uniref:Uncharacterized protein n=1 Tax=Oryzias latipes TaxID=8090 RepID=A0A3B3IBS6_ORYLA
MDQLMFLMRTLHLFQFYFIFLRNLAKFQDTKLILTNLKPYHWGATGWEGTLLFFILRFKDISKSDLNRWLDFFLSFIGRISLIKMNILPRINKNTFAAIERFLSKFLWHGKKPRLKMMVIQRPLDRGSQTLPYFQYYYWACHLHSWCYEPFSLLSLLSLDPTKLPVGIINNTILIVTLRFWNGIRNKNGFGNKLFQCDAASY